MSWNLLNIEDVSVLLLRYFFMNIITTGYNRLFARRKYSVHSIHPFIHSFVYFTILSISFVSDLVLTGYIPMRFLPLWSLDTN